MLWRMLRFYLLDEQRRPFLVCGDPTKDPAGFMKWARVFNVMDRQVRRDELPLALVSTVFLGMDHSWWDNEAAPQVFETMVFANPAIAGPMKDFQERCSTWAEAVAIHERVMEEILKAHQEAAG